MVARARWGAGLLALVLTTGVVSLTAPVQAAEPVPSAMWDPAGASAAARKGGQRVEVAGMRSETTQVFANPDGSWTSEEFAEPVRTRSRSGAWSEIDTTLVAGPDGTVRPKAPIVNMEFSGGGNSLLARTLRAGGEASVGWTAKLPKPVLSGSTATYPEVLAGVDLVLTAETAGYSKVLVVKNKQAATNPKLKELAFTLSAKGGLKWTTSGGTLKAVDADGDAVLGSSQPVMWDSSANVSTAAAVGGRAVSDVHGPAVGAKRAQLPLTLSSGRAAIKPDTSLLSGPDTVFPLFIDPAIGYASWTMINGAAPTQSYWNFDKTNCPSGFSTECAKVGHHPDDSMTKYRSLFQFAGTAYKGKHVLGSKFTIDLLYSGYSAASVTELWKSNSTIGSSTTWNNNAAGWATKLATVSNSSYPAARKATSFASTALTSTVTTAAPAGAVLTFGLKATNDAGGWKKFDAKTAKLVVDFNSLPGVPASPTVEGRGVENPRPVLGTATPELRAVVTDADVETDLIGKFEWERLNPADSTWAALGSGSKTGLRKDETAVVKIGSGLVDGGIYRFRARTEDPWSYGGSSGVDVSAWTGWVEFEVDSDGPNVAPTVSSPDYGTDPNQVYGSIGKTGAFTFAPNGVVDTAGYKWGWTDQPTNDAPTALGQPATLQITPPSPKPDRPAEGGELILSVQSYDRAGRTGPLAHYKFTVGNATGPVGEWKLDQAAGATSAADASGNGHDAAIYGATSGVEGRLLHPSAPTSTRFDGLDDSLATTNPVIDTSTSFTASVWARSADPAAGKTVLSTHGPEQSSFFIFQTGGRWAFGYKEAETGSAASNPMWAQGPVIRANVWTHLVGVYDKQTQELKFYVDGALANTRSVTTIFKATAGLGIGYYWGAGRQAEHWNGDIAEVGVWDRVLSEGEIAPKAATLMGEWGLDSAGYDNTAWGNDTTANGGVAWAADRQGNPDMAALLDGTGSLETTAPVLRTDQSYTVAAWVRLNDSLPQDAWPTVLSQGKADESAFMLYRAADRWCLAIRRADGTSFEVVATIAALGEWTHVAAIYDAAAGKLRVYVNGVDQASADFTASWASTDPFQIGRSRWHGNWDGYFDGAVDDVRAYQGVLPASEIAKLAR